MKQNNCPECGYPLNGTENICPECGYSIPQVETTRQTQQQPQQQSNEKDMAQYFYECGVIGWNSFKKYFCFEGRASRREFWSLVLIFTVSWLTLSSISGFTETGKKDWFIALFIVFFLPNIGAQVRRLHDIGRSGFWCLCPIVPLFMYLKKSDTGVNKYGPENPAKNLL